MKTLNAAWEKADVSKKWEESAWAKKIAAKERVKNFFINLI